jgi:hypothetical protein
VFFDDIRAGRKPVGDAASGLSAVLMAGAAKKRAHHYPVIVSPSSSAAVREDGFFALRRRFINMHKFHSLFPLKIFPSVSQQILQKQLAESRKCAMATPHKGWRDKEISGIIEP